MGNLTIDNVGNEMQVMPLCPEVTGTIVIGESTNHNRRESLIELSAEDSEISWTVASGDTYTMKAVQPVQYGIPADVVSITVVNSPVRIY